MAGRRTPKEVIDEAIRHTEPLNNLCYWILAGLALAGVVSIIIGAVRGDFWTGGIGTVPIGVCWPVLVYAMRLRQQNALLRMLEVVLNNVKTAPEAHAAIRDAFGFHFGQSEVGTNVVVPESTSTGSGNSP